MTQNILTALGFKRKRQVDYVADMQAKAKEIFGANVNLNDNSPMGKWINLLSFQHAESNELTEKVWLSAHVDTAEGVALDYAVKKYGITRFPSNAATGNITLTLTPGKVIAAGAITVSTTGGVKFVNTAGGTASGTTLILPVVAVLDGPAANVPAGTINVINTPISGVSAVTNTEATTGGRNQETDAQLRTRYYSSLSSGGSTADGVRAVILEIPSVRAAVVLENKTNAVDSEGRPPNCIAPVILGGDPEEVAAAILSKKPGGIRSYGTEVYYVKDNSGNDQDIGFSYATPIDIYADVTISTNAAFPVDGPALVETEVIKYIGGTDANNESHAGLGMGADVIYTKIVGAIIRNVPGIDDLTLTLRKTSAGSGVAANIVINNMEVAGTDPGKVVVTVG